jgi:hypothetical protein
MHRPIRCHADQDLDNPPGLRESLQRGAWTRRGEPNVLLVRPAGVPGLSPTVETVRCSSASPGAKSVVARASQRDHG